MDGRREVSRGHGDSDIGSSAANAAHERFDDDYLLFHLPLLDDEVSERDAALAWSIADLRPGGVVLDLACGHGRIANRLASRGAVVTGLDATRLFLDLGREQSEAMGTTVRFVEGDMRSIPWRAEFDAVVCWYTSFGYFNDDENRTVLRGVRESLKSGGRFLLELPHRDSLLARFAATSVSKVDDAYMVDRRSFDPLTGQLHTDRVIARHGELREYGFSIRLLSYTELCGWLREAGFIGIEGFAGDGSPLTVDSRRMIVRATA